MADTELLRKISEWMTFRFALNTNAECKIWTFIVGAAAHLELLAVIILWEKERRPDSFDNYQPKISLGQAISKIEKESLLDAATVDTIKAVAHVRNSVSHRNATLGVSFPTSNVGLYKGRHVFTDPAGLQQLADDTDDATCKMKVCLGKLRDQK